MTKLFHIFQETPEATTVGNLRSGTFRSNLSGEAAYKSFIPSPLPPVPEIVMDENLTKALIAANSRLAVLEELTSKIPDMALFVSMYVRKEALMSSQIEGTQATLEDVLDPMDSSNANKNVAEVINYIRATEYAINRLQTLPLCTRLIKETHAVLMNGVRGQERNPGEFRHSQNWIGSQGSTIKNARYIPPCPDDMVTALSDLEKYINNDNDGYDSLIKAALIHYQFETIHPFLDGNGRIGRLLITLYLIEAKVISSPALYISYFLKRNRIEYYDRLTEVRNKGNYEQWILFFLTAVRECADDAIATVYALSALHEKNVCLINTLGKSRTNARMLFDYLETSPIIDISQTSKSLGLSFNTVSAAVKKLINSGILVQTENRNRNRTFAYSQYIDILRNGTE